ncbi:atlastin-1-like [Gigantopelta aegis]|uniref:atlastin-1-like n=1 Tax=Gigantopelta aegis TaxID=1735272 RepID=UPI001B88CD29|nr:atlastin-1-like [Gigantopelta aegis]
MENTEANADATNLESASVSRSQYIRDMGEVIGGDRPYVHPNWLEEQHQRCLQQAEQLFNQTKTATDPEIRKKDLSELREGLEDAYENFKQQNEIKTHATRTPAALLSVLVVAYLLAKVLDVIGFTTVAFLLNVVTFFFLVLALTWLLVPYTEGHRNISNSINELADFIWDYMLCVVYTRAA